MSEVGYEAKAAPARQPIIALYLALNDSKLNDYIALGEGQWSNPHSFYVVHSDGSISSTVTTAIPSMRISPAFLVSPIPTAVPPLPSDNRVSKKRKRPYPCRQEVHSSIASRLPTRSQATIHRRLHTVVARRLLPRTANQATYNRNRRTRCR